MGERKRSKVGEAFVLILQIGLAMLVAVGMMAALAVFLDNRFHTIWFMPPFLVLGFAGGIRAAYNLVQVFLKSDGTAERRAYDLTRKLEKERRSRKSADQKQSDTKGEDHTIEVYKRK